MRKIALSIIASMMMLYASSNNELFIGDTHEFAEKDMLEAIQQHLTDNKEKIEKRFEEEKIKAKEKIKQYQPDGLIALEPALKDNVFEPDMSYTLDRDIKDAEGNIIYKKGFTFNPLKYAKLGYGIVVINGKNRQEVEWFKNSKYANTIAYRLLITDGSYYDLIKELNQQVFYCLPEITKRFQLKHTPSIVVQKREKIEVSEICLSCREKEVDNAKN
ncbi:conjugal transfer protein TraW (plasmid) [Campylobacter iguaniorum]|uniref:Conjugal transfer protein TraW n=1 Tax=Campylobacter iguaniorum TaxID=1244531 RepID=A0A076FBJ5_9BACT|nr:chromosome segregation protein ParM [Campylobacter iguaniorum]AII15600.1 conjugal transfer protein TraW [Campylobacter iguaniorum]